jgi:hypothetical protein
MEPIANRQRQRQSIDRAQQYAGARTGDEKKGTSTNELPPLTERRAREFAWAAEHLPNEHTGSVVSALIGLEVAGEKQSTASVMARLERQGRTKAQGWIR